MLFSAANQGIIILSSTIVTMPGRQHSTGPVLLPQIQKAEEQGLESGDSPAVGLMASWPLSLHLPQYQKRLNKAPHSLQRLDDVRHTRWGSLPSRDCKQVLFILTLTFARKGAQLTADTAFLVQLSPLPNPL